MIGLHATLHTAPICLPQAGKILVTAGKRATILDGLGHEVGLDFFNLYGLLNTRDHDVKHGEAGIKWRFINELTSFEQDAGTASPAVPILFMWPDRNRRPRTALAPQAVGGAEHPVELHRKCTVRFQHNGTFLCKTLRRQASTSFFVQNTCGCPSCLHSGRNLTDLHRTVVRFDRRSRQPLGVIKSDFLPTLLLLGRIEAEGAFFIERGSCVVVRCKLSFAKLSQGGGPPGGVGANLYCFPSFNQGFRLKEEPILNINVVTEEEP